MAAARDENLSAMLRDLKKFSSKQIIKAIKENGKEGRKNWMLRVFKEQGENNNRNKEYEFPEAG